MRKNFGVKTWLYPMPVLIIGTYNDDGSPNVMNAAWGGIHDTNQVGVCIDVGHKTSRNILVRKCFTVNVGDAAHVVACDYVGIVSGNNDAGKFEKSGFHACCFSSCLLFVVLIWLAESAGCGFGAMVSTGTMWLLSFCGWAGAMPEFRLSFAVCTLSAGRFVLSAGSGMASG